MLSDAGHMIGLDAGFCAIMQAEADTMIGRGVLDVTVPEDRQRCRAAMIRLRQTGEPFAVRKRMRRDDGSIVWVEQAITRVDFPDAAPTIIATFRPIAAPSDRNHPCALLGQARFLCESGSDRRDMLGSPLFANVPWDLLLKAYIAEAEGRTIDVAEMARSARLTPTVAWRWTRALASEGLLEVEAGGCGGAGPVYRLTADAHARLEAYLSGRLRKLADVGAIA